MGMGNQCALLIAVQCPVTKLAATVVRHERCEALEKMHKVFLPALPLLSAMQHLPALHMSTLIISKGLAEVPAARHLSPVMESLSCMH